MTISLNFATMFQYNQRYHILETYMHFLNPTNDLAFKRIFGNAKKKNILISFLNSILHLDGEETVTDVTLLNPSQVPHIKGAKETILDVRCHDQSGAEYIVEMQVLQQQHFDQRVLYYVSQAYTHQLEQGMTYNELRPVIFLGILNFDFTQNNHYRTIHKIYDIETQEHIFRDFCFTFVELPKFTKEEKDLATVEDKWIYFLKHATTLQAIPEVIHEAALKDAFEIIEKVNWNKQELESYTRRAMQVQIEADRVGFGYVKGKTEGIAEGIVKAKIEIAANLLATGMDIETITKLTGLSADELKKL